MKADENPFRSSAVADLRYEIDSGARDALVARLERNHWRACILGPEGTGKTTLMEDLEAPVAARGKRVVWVRLSLDSRPPEVSRALAVIRELGPDDVVFLDGGEVLGWLRWWQVQRLVRVAGAGLLATVHLRRFLPVIHETRRDPNRVLDLARRLAGPHWSVDLAFVAEAACRDSRANAREVFRACYKYCAEQL